MAAITENSEMQANLKNGSPENDRLQSLVHELQEECNRLRRMLSEVETERDGYRQLFLSSARAAREFEDLDIPTLQAMSAGPIDVMD